jgi:hypothetical protein
VLLEAGKLPLLRFDADSQRIALGDEALKRACRIEQEAFYFPLGALIAGSRSNAFYIADDGHDASLAVSSGRDLRCRCVAFSSPSVYHERASAR